MEKNELKHHGVKGMHWGVRRYQNYDGTRIGAKRRQSGGGFDRPPSYKTKVRNLVSKGVNDKPLGLKAKELNKKRLQKASEAASRDAQNLREHGYMEEAKAVQKVADRNKQKAMSKKEVFQEKASDYATERMKNKDYSNATPEEIMNDWGKFKKEYKNKERLRSKMDELDKSAVVKEIKKDNSIKAEKAFNKKVEDNYTKVYDDAAARHNRNLDVMRSEYSSKELWINKDGLFDGPKAKEFVKRLDADWKKQYSKSMLNICGESPTQGKDYIKNDPNYKLYELGLIAEYQKKEL